VLKHYPLRGSNASQITTSAERAIAAGVLTPGMRLPSVRALATRLAVSPATVAAAYHALKLRGLVSGAGRRGTVISAMPPLVTRSAPPVPPNVRNLADGRPDPALLPAVPQGLRGPWQHGYGEPYNRAELIELAAAMFRADGIAAGPIALVSGALDAIERLLQANLRIGDRVAVEDPGYPPVLDLLAALGLRAEPVALDDYGPIPADLSRALSSGVAALIITPRAQNPTGAALDAVRANDLRRILKFHGSVMLIEDDHAGVVAGAPAVSLSDSGVARWAVVRSQSKSLGPDLRVAFVTGDGMTIARLEGRLRLGAGWVSHILQELVWGIWSDPGTAALVKRAEAAYTARRQALLTALAEHRIAARGRSGFNVWIPVPEEFAVIQSMLAAGWAVSAGERYRIKSPPAVRVSVGTLRPLEARRFAADLARCLAPPHRAHYA
jgi:DNA-binding transcriptional MocR family regulator